MNSLSLRLGSTHHIWQLFGLFLSLEVPSAPVGPLHVSNITDRSADIAWNPPDSDGGTPLTGYIVQMRVIPRSTFTTVQQTADTKLTLTGLLPDSQYMVQIIATNVEGQSQPLISKEPICPKKILSKSPESGFPGAASGGCSNKKRCHEPIFVHDHRGVPIVAR